MVAILWYAHPGLRMAEIYSRVGLQFFGVLAYNQSMSLPPHLSASKAGNTPVDEALAGARDEALVFFGKDIPPGCEAEVLDQAVRANRMVEQIRYAALTMLAAQEAAGTLLEEGGQRSVQAWITHQWGTSPAEAHNLAVLARALHKQQLPLVAKAFQEKTLSLGEACAIATSTEKATADWAQVREQGDEEFRKTHPDTDEYRARLEY